MIIDTKKLSSFLFIHEQQVSFFLRGIVFIEAKRTRLFFLYFIEDNKYLHKIRRKMGSIINFYVNWILCHRECLSLISFAKYGSVRTRRSSSNTTFDHQHFGVQIMKTETFIHMYEIVFAVKWYLVIVANEHKCSQNTNVEKKGKTNINRKQKQWQKQQKWNNERTEVHVITWMCKLCYRYTCRTIAGSEYFESCIGFFLLLSVNFFFIKGMWVRGWTGFFFRLATEEKKRDK